MVITVSDTCTVPYSGCVECFQQPEVTANRHTVRLLRVEAEIELRWKITSATLVSSLATGSAGGWNN